MRKSPGIVLILMLGIVMLFSSVALAVEYKGEKPEEFSQAPVLQELVEKGELPPLEERLPATEDLYVVDPFDEVGQFGGTITTATTSPKDMGDAKLLHSPVTPVKPNAEVNKMVPELAKKIESSEDKTTWIFHIREGIKWSDGEPFTAEDMIFTYKDVMQNKEINPVMQGDFVADGEPAEIKKINDYTVQYKFKVPRPLFLNSLFDEGGMIAPKHYLEQFHPKYVSEEELKEKTEEAGYDQWYQLFQAKNDHWMGMPLNKDLPTLCAWVLSEKTSDKLVYERNPYFWKVDTEGNQLPYVDKIESRVVSDNEVIQGMIMSAKLDFVGYYSSVSNYPLYREYMDEGNFRPVLWSSGLGSAAVYMFNQTYKGDEGLRDIFQNVKFRKAMSLAIDREDINQTIFFGKATPRQWTLLPQSKYFEEEFAESYIDYDPERAKELLEEIGIVDEDGDGWLERPDGEQLQFNIAFQSPAPETPKGEITQLVAQHWQDIGINVDAKPMSAELLEQRGPSSELQVYVWHGDGATDILFPTYGGRLVPREPSWDYGMYPEWSRWFYSNGEAGEEPPARLKKVWDWWQDMLSNPDEEERIELGKKILRSQAENLWGIGTVGMSPHVMIVDEKMSNFPEIEDGGNWAWDTLHGMNLDPEQFYFKE